MKLYLSEDEKYPHIFVTSEEQAEEDRVLGIEQWERITYRESPKRPVPDRFGMPGLSDLRDVPDDIGAELVAIRKREAELLELIEKHLQATGQPPLS